MLPKRPSLWAAFTFMTVSYGLRPPAKGLDLFPTKYLFCDQEIVRATKDSEVIRHVCSAEGSRLDVIDL